MQDRLLTWTLTIDGRKLIASHHQAEHRTKVEALFPDERLRRARARFLSGDAIVETNARCIASVYGVALEDMAVPTSRERDQHPAHTLTMTAYEDAASGHELVVFGATLRAGRASPCGGASGPFITLFVRPGDGSGTWYRNLNPLKYGLHGEWVSVARLGDPILSRPLAFEIRAHLTRHPVSGTNLYPDESALRRALARARAWAGSATLSVTRWPAPRSDSPRFSTPRDGDVLSGSFRVTWRGAPLATLEVYSRGERLDVRTEFRSGDPLELAAGRYELKLRPNTGFEPTDSLWVTVRPRRTARASRDASPRRP